MKNSINAWIFATGDVCEIPTEIMRRAKKLNGRRSTNDRRTRGAKHLLEWAQTKEQQLNAK